MLVFEDADLDAAVEWIMFGIFFNQGQVCSATSKKHCPAFPPHSFVILIQRHAGRLLVQEGIADELVRKLKQEVQKLRLGDPLTCEPPCMGPLISQPQLDKVLRYIQTGLQGTPCPALVIDCVQMIMTTATTIIASEAKPGQLTNCCWAQQMGLNWWLAEAVPPI